MEKQVSSRNELEFEQWIWKEYSGRLSGYPAYQPRTIIKRRPTISHPDRVSRGQRCLNFWIWFYTAYCTLLPLQRLSRASSVDPLPADGSNGSLSFDVATGQ